jgi:thiamine pyrophosphate-dependent acetolactate synthase large subunit-like protein
VAKSKESLARRVFLKGAATGAAALAAQGPLAAAQQVRAAAKPDAETGTASAPVEVLTTDRPGGDFAVDVLKSLGFEYACANPSSSLKGLHESLINYGGNKNPEYITCCHEESAVAMAHGYYKIEGKPLAVLVHGTVGLQHAAMAIYNAHCDRVPLMIIAGNWSDIEDRGSYTDWTHSAQDIAALVRDYVKWDDAPTSLGAFAESAVRAYKIAMTPPMEPVVIVADAKWLEEPIKESGLRVPKLTPTGFPQGDSAAVAQAAKILVAAENPVIVAGRAARTQHGIELLVELAETLQAAVVDQRNRMNFPSSHPLYGAGTANNADVILGLEVQDFFALTHRGTPANRKVIESKWRSTGKPGAKMISISALDLNHRTNYQDFGRYTELDLAIPADAEATLPSLIEECKRLITPDRKRAFEARGAKLAEVHRQNRERARQQAALGWDSSPISSARIAAELWAQIKTEDWSLVSKDGFFNTWPTRLWDFSKHYQYIGAEGGAGIGYGAPAAVGAALANRKYGRLTINIQNDGDLNYAPGVLWTAAHHRIPLLTIMNNNRAYHQEHMDIVEMSARANRSPENAGIGTTITDPNIDYANMARTYGMFGIGPITDPKDVGPSIKRALEVVKSGQPALIDTVTHGR